MKFINYFAIHLLLSVFFTLSYFTSAKAAKDNLSSWYTQNSGTVINLASLPSVHVSTSFVSPHENLSAVNDGLVPSNSRIRTYPIYGNWNGELYFNTFNWVEYEWSLAHTITSVTVYWFVDDGGLLTPTDAYIEYWDGFDWINAGEIGKELDKFNVLDTDFVSNKIRIYMRSIASVGIAEFEVHGIETEKCDPSEIISYTKTNNNKAEEKNYANILTGGSVTITANVEDENGKWQWSGPENFQSTEKELTLENLQPEQSGTYKVTYVNDCGTISSRNFYLTVTTSLDGSEYTWSEYSPTISYNFKDEYPDLEMPTKDLEDCSGIAGTISSGWWTFHWGHTANPNVTEAAIYPMLERMNEDFAYYRDVMGWPPDKRAKEGYRSAIYLYGSGLCTDNANNTTDLGGWQGAVDYKGESWPMVLLSWYPVYAFDPNSTQTDREYQMGAVVHEGIHSILADMPGCKNAAWFHEGGNTWLQQEADSDKAGDYSSMGFLNGAPFIAPFMPIECYSGWLQDETFGGPSAEGVNMFNGSQQICTWKNYLGGTQYGNSFPVFLGQTLGNGSIPWIWRYCESRVLEGIADGIGENQTRRLIMEYRAKQALLDMGKWTGAFRQLMNDHFTLSIKAEWEPYWINSDTWKATPYAKTTKDKEGYLVPEYRTTPGWSGGNQIPLHVEGDIATILFEPLGENMSCQLCYRSEDGEAIYGEPVYAGECSLQLNKKPANGVIFAVISNTNYIYEGEETRTAHFNYRIKLGEGVTRTADIYKKWFNWDTTINDPLSIESEKEKDNLNIKVYPNPAPSDAPLKIEFDNPTGEIITIYMRDISGKTVYTNRTTDNIMEIPSSSLRQGIYITTIHTPKAHQSVKLIIQ